MANLLHSPINKVFEDFFTVVSNNFNIDIEKVRRVCTNVCTPGVAPVKVPVKAPVKVPVKKGTTKGLNKKDSKAFEEAMRFIASDSEMGKLTVEKLKEKCRAKNLKLTGTKSELIKRLENPTNPENKVGGKRTKKSLFKTRDVSKIIEKLQGTISTLAVRKNSEGKYVHLDTNLVFDPTSHKVIGRWKDNQVKWLTKSDVEMCLTLGVQFELPENLDLGIVKIVDKAVEEVLGDDDFKEDMDESSADEEMSDEEDE